MTTPEYDIAIIGGGFFGCCLALYLKTVADKIVVLESEEALMLRASRINQARVHTGFHYPRSFVTAMRSRSLQSQFVKDFEAAILDDFDMLYAIARRRSKVSANRFLRMFQSLNAPIAPAARGHTALFNPDLIEEVFQCKEFAFDWKKLRDLLSQKLERSKIDLRLQCTAERVVQAPGKLTLELSGGSSVSAGTVLNVTYSNINGILLNSGLELLKLKHELTEIALVEPPDELHGLAVTVMDGPFFSTMPYPSEGLYSLTHVRYTPHFSWVDEPNGLPAYATAQKLPKETRWRHMMLDSQRYVPALSKLRFAKSLFEVKTVLPKNERDDGRPIVLHRHTDVPGLYSIMGAKIDNVYDLFEVIGLMNDAWRDADGRHLFG